jgi:hypothetical protein
LITLSQLIEIADRKVAKYSIITKHVYTSKSKCAKLAKLIDNLQMAFKYTSIFDIPPNFVNTIVALARLIMVPPESRKPKLAILDLILHCKLVGLIGDVLSSHVSNS